MKLAIDGGTPIRESFLPYGKQWINEEDIDIVVRTLKSANLTQGPMIEEFEKKIAAYIGAKYAIAFSSGTAALHAACYAAGVGEGDEVITTPITFAASANCALYLGAKPVFVDIDERTYNINPHLIEKSITTKTKAIIPVDFTGQPADLDLINHIARKHNLVVIEDAAHALGATYKGRKVGTLADMTMFSFHPVKHITTAEGGMIVTDSEEYAEKLRLFRTHGIFRDKDRIIDEPWFYEMIDLGYNYRITDIQAALGISQLNRLDQFVKMRRDIASIYNKFLVDIEGLSVPQQMHEVESSWHLYIIRLDTSLFHADRKQIFKALRAENIGVNVHYIPVYYHPYYQRLGYSRGTCPVAEKWYEEIITLPLFPSMDMDDIKSVIDAIKKVLNFYRKTSVY